MIDTLLSHRPTRLLLLLSAFFVTNALLAEFIGVKIFSLEQTFGMRPFSFSLFGEKNLAFNLTCGVLLWPVVFVMTDLINEYFGKKAVKTLSWLTVGLIGYAFVMVFAAVALPPAGFWPGSMAQAGVPDMNAAYRAVFGQGLWIIIGSMVAFLVGQLLDVTIFQALRRRTGEGQLWLRATGSTLVSQLIDSYVVLFIAFKIGGNWSWQLVLAVGMMNYIYKFLVALAMTPVLYGVHNVIDNYLGAETSAEMRQAASEA